MKRSKKRQIKRQLNAWQKYKNKVDLKRGATYVIYFADYDRCLGAEGSFVSSIGYSSRSSRLSKKNGGKVLQTEKDPAKNRYFSSKRFVYHGGRFMFLARIMSDFDEVKHNGRVLIKRVK